MRIPCLFQQCSIRQRLMMINGITFVLILSLITIYTYQLISLEKKMVDMGEVDDLLNSILEVRRYEKNIMLQLGGDNARLAKDALERVELHLCRLGRGDLAPRQTELLALLRRELNNYREVFDRWCGSDACGHPGMANTDDAHALRDLGGKLVERATELTRTNRKAMHQAVKRILFWLTFLPANIFLLGAFIFFSQVKSILDRLSFLEQGTRTLAAGEFKAIPINPAAVDEISGLIVNFNQMVEALEQKQEELIQSKKMASIGTFSSGIAHEINNPLNNISLSTDTLLEELEDMDGEEIREILEDIMEQTARASKIVRNLLDFSRAQSSEMQPFHIDFVIHKTTDLISNELNIHKIKLVKDLPDMLPQVNGDLQKLQQVFLNLIINAEQAMGEGGTITVRARTTEDGYVRTDVIDDGPGIAPEHLEQIFDPFFTTKEAGKGTGLGLSIVYGIVKKHGGYIEVASKLGQGTTFSVYLPIYEDNEEQATEE